MEGRKVWVFGADSDSEYAEYEDELINPGKSYNMRTKDAISEKAQRRHVKLGIERREGHYQLQVRNSSRSGRPTTSHFYGGHHWEIGPISMVGRDMSEEERARANPLLLEHTTRRLTVKAVDCAMDLEKTRRTKHEDREREMAVRLYCPINRELIRLIAYNLDEEKRAKKSYHVLVEAEKESILQELLHGTNQKTVHELMEEEQERRVQLLQDLTDPDKCADDKELLAILKGLAKTQQIMQDVHLELKEGINDLEEICQEENHAVDDLYMELKDDFVSSFRRATLLMKFHMAEENEKRRRMAEARALFTGKIQLDTTQRHAMRNKGLMQEELTRMYAGVMQLVSQQEAKLEDGTHTHKVETQEQLLHRLAIKQADQAEARERAERIKEMEEDLNKKPDPYKEHVKDVILNVQEQMLVKKFHGKKMMFRQKHRQEYHEAESEQDRKLREVRMKSRRRNTVVMNN